MKTTTRKSKTHKTRQTLINLSRLRLRLTFSARRLISMLLSIVMLITSTPFMSIADALDTPCSFGGTIEPPIGDLPNLINGNVLGSNGKGALDIDVLNLVSGTCVEVNDIRGIKATIWSLNGGGSGNTRQLYVGVNGALSPMFATNTTDPTRIFMVREAVHDIEWEFNTAQLNSINSNEFNITIRVTNAVWGVGPISFIGENGDILGTSTYSTQNSSGEWNAFIPNCECCEYCGYDPCRCDDDKCEFGGIIAPATGNYPNFVNANSAGSSGRGNVEIDVLDLIGGTHINANDIYGIEVATWGESGVNGPENRQAYINVNGVNSPKFHASRTINPSHICSIMSHGSPSNNGGRTELQTLRYMNEYYGSHATDDLGELRPFVSTMNPSSFIVKIRPNDSHAAVVTSVMLLDINGDVLGATSYSTLGSDGVWSKFESFVTDATCERCGEETEPGDNTGNKSQTYAKEDYTVDYAITNGWVENGQQKQTIKVTITNTSAKVIENWMLAYNFNGDIEGIWNASVQKTDNMDLDFIRNMGHNANILPGQSISFGYILTSVKGTPVDIVMCQERVKKDGGYSAYLNVLNDWGTAFNGEIVLENNTDDPIEWWDLTFNTNFTITEIVSSWAATFTDNGNCNYTFKGTYTGIIAPHSEVRLGFQAIKDNAPEVYAEELYEFVVSETAIYSTTTSRPTEYSVYDGWLLYSESGDTVIIHGFANDIYDTDLVIPSMINGKTVSEIGVGAFAGENITCVTLPNTIVKIDDFAFSESMLETIMIPYSVKKIGVGAFQDSMLSGIDFAAGTADLSIGMAAFANCVELEGIVLPDRTVRIDDFAFSESGIVSVEIGSGIEEIPAGAFEKCESLISISIPRQIISIGSSAFYNCISLEMVEFETPSGLEVIGDYAFHSSVYLSELEIPSNTIIIGDNALPASSEDFTIDEKNNLVKYNGLGGDVIIPYGVEKIGTAAFTDCKKLTSIVIPDTVEGIGGNAFERCDNLIEITIPNSVKSIGFFAFADCPNLVSFEFESPSEVESIGYGAFLGNESLKTITIPDSVNAIGVSAFKDSGLTTIKLGAGINELGTTPLGGLFCTIFDGVPYLTTIIVSDDNELFSSEDGVLFNKDKTTLIQYPIARGNYKYTIPSEVTRIETDAFSNNIKLTSVEMLDGVLKIGERAFNNCTNLKTIEISDSVIDIKKGAFSGTEWFKNQPNGLVYVGKVLYTFKGNAPENTVIELRDDTKGIAEHALIYVSGVIKTTIPNKVEFISMFAFNSCQNLESIIFKSENPPTFDNDKFIVFNGCDALSKIYVPIGTKTAYERALEKELKNLRKTNEVEIIEVEFCELCGDYLCKCCDVCGGYPCVCCKICGLFDECECPCPGCESPDRNCACVLCDGCGQLKENVALGLERVCECCDKCSALVGGCVHCDECDELIVDCICGKICSECGMEECVCNKCYVCNETTENCTCCIYCNSPNPETCLCEYCTNCLAKPCEAREPFKLGRILGDDTITISDALQILMYLANIEANVIGMGVKKYCENAWNAALIMKTRAGDRPEIGDALEILMYLANIKQSVLFRD